MNYKISDKYVDHVLSLFKEFHEAMKRGGDVELVTTIFSTLICYAPEEFQRSLVASFEGLKGALTKKQTELEREPMDDVERRFAFKQYAQSLFFEFFRMVKYAFDAAGTFVSKEVMAREVGWE